MKHFRHIVFSISLLVALICITHANANAQQINVSLFNADNGLPQSQVNCLFQDSLGFLWVGTQDGLVCYDGYEFKTYSHNPIDSNSIANNYIYSIVEDNNNDLWIGTRAGVSRYERSKGIFRNYYSNPDDHTALSNPYVYSILIDNELNIWVKTVDALHLYNPKKDSFTKYLHFNNVFNTTLDYDLFPLVEDSQGKIWMGTKDGLFQFNKEKKSFRQIKIGATLREKSNRILSIYEDNKQVLWIGTEDGLFQCGINSDTCKRFKATSNSISGNNIVFIGEDFDGTMWVGTEKGLSLIDQGKYVRSINEVVSNGDIISLIDVVSVIRDRSRVLWIGTQSGLMKWSYYNQRFKSFSKDNEGMNLFAGNIVASILSEPNGTIWVGTWGTGLFRFNPFQSSIVSYSSHKSGHHIVDDFVHVIFRRKDGTILIGTRNGVMQYNSATGQFIRFAPLAKPKIFNKNRVYAIAEDLEGILWFATRLGLYMVKPNGDVKSYAPNSPDSLRILGAEVRDVIVDSKGFVWAATSNGLNRIHPSSNVVDNFTKGKRVSDKTLNTNDLLCLCEDSKGNIWIGSSAGIYKYDVITGVFSMFSDNRNLVNGLIYSIEEDDNGRIWLSTNRGIVLLNAEASFVRGFTTNDGLLSNEFNLGSSYKSDDGTIYFGSIAGFNFFNPDSIKLNYAHPKVVITSIEVMGNKGELMVFPPNSKKIKITEGFKFLNIEFTSLDFNLPDRNEYRYKIEGYDDRWNEIGTKHAVTFTNLKERTYIFKVMGSNSDRVWAKEPQVLKIVVSAPFWRSRMAILVYVVVVFSVLSIFISHRRRNLVKINKLLKEREFVLNELEEQKKELEITNKSITDSIHYAKRIQEAIMPSVNVFKSILPDSFILYMPKDIVSGDFYWINETHNKTFIAAVDCTGHGVPGAFMSIIGIELLRNITSVEGVDDAAEILNKLSYNIYETFSSGINEEGVKVKDGMDVAFCVIDREYNTLQYAGALSNLFLLRDGKIIEISGDRYSVGATTDQGSRLYSSYYIPLQPNDMIYILTDGYVDQFGGVEGKKFKLRRFRHLLLNMHRLPLEMQRKYLFDTIVAWKGMQEQVDDILVIGIRPDLSCLF